ncbi:MAG: MMPL family transporter [Turneriella sp.]|nr:MMPL family transporter [Turneriella sp.]
MLARFWALWLYHAKRYSWLLFLILLVTAFLGYRYGRHIRIDTNLLHLLPRDNPALKRLDSLRRKSPVRGFLVVTFSAESPRHESELVALVEMLRQKIAGDAFLSTGTAELIARMPAEFLQRYALWYMETQDLQKIAARLEQSIADAKRRANPYFEDLEDSAPVPFYIGDIVHKYRHRYTGSGYFTDAQKTQIAVLLALREPPENIVFAREYLNRMESAIAKEAKARGFSMVFFGKYASNVHRQQRLAEAIHQSTTLTFLVLVASLMIFFRSLRVLWVVGLPVVAALGYTYFAAWYWMGEISIISSFLTAILLGLGIDYGIHLFARYKTERVRGLGMSEALAVAMHNLFRGLSFGMVTTAAVFLTLSFSRFIAFAEFGRIAFAGVIFFFISFIIYFPAIVFLTERFSFGVTETSSLMEKSYRIRGWLILLILVVCGYGILTLWKPPFEYDFFALEPDEPARQELPGPLAILENREYRIIYEFKTTQELRHAEEHLRRLVPPESVETHSLLDLIPQDIGRKQVWLRRIHALLVQAEQYLRDSGDPDTLRKIRQGLRMTATAPPGWDDIPQVFRQHLIFEGHYYLYAFAKKVSSFPRGVLDFAARIRTLCQVKLQEATECPAGKTTTGISELYVLDELLHIVLRDIRSQVAAIVIVIAIIVISLTRRLAGVCLILLPLLTGMLALFALLGAGHQLTGHWLFSLNYVNVLAIPILLGVGIDNGIHLYSHARMLGLAQVNQIMASTGGSVFISNFTTSVGFLSLAVADHRGLAAFGFLTFSGMLTIFYSYRLLFPALARLFQKWEAEI